MVHAERCEHTLAFLERAQRWQDTCNYLRPHFGGGMEGKSPTEKPKSYGAMINERVLLFPVILAWKEL